MSNQEGSIRVENAAYLNEQIQKRYDETGLGTPEGLEKIGSGHNRIVHRIVDDTYGSEVKGMVLKVQYPSSRENQKEIQLWSKYEGTDYEDYLVPIKAYSDSHSWIIQPYGRTVPIEKVNSEIYNTLCELGSDISQDDFIVLNGDDSPRCCDYASLDI